MAGWRKIGRAITVALTMAAAYLAGAFSAEGDIWPLAALRQKIRHPSPPSSLPSGWQSTSDDHFRLTRFLGKTAIACPPQTDKTMVLLAIGQSNAANHQGQRYVSAYGDRVVNYFDGKCFIAASPLLGASGLMGESWTLLGNKLIAAGMADRVVLIPAAIGATKIERWAPGGDLNLMLMAALDEVKPHYGITQVLWHQGESDYGQRTPKEDYVRMFSGLVRSLRHRGVTAPIFPSVATTCEYDPQWVADNPIALAQQSLADKAGNVIPGVNSDALVGAMDRYDGCHFSATGQEKFAEAWVAVLRAAR